MAFGVGVAARVRVRPEFRGEIRQLSAQGVDDVLVTVGGTIPAEDIPELKKLGVSEVFTPGAGTDEIVEFIRENASERDDV